MKEKKPLLFDVDILEEDLSHSSSRRSSTNASEPIVEPQKENISNAERSGFPTDILRSMRDLRLKSDPISPEPKKTNTNNTISHN